MGEEVTSLKYNLLYRRLSQEDKLKFRFCRFWLAVRLNFFIGKKLTTPTCEEIKRICIDFWQEMSDRGMV